MPDEEIEEEVESCSNCGEESCECVECPAPRCRIRVHSEDQCPNCERCDDCCICTRCPECGSREDICSNCDYCSDHDDCSYCEGCDSRTSNRLCDGCDNCSDCCDCSEIFKFSGMLRFWEASKKQFKVNPNKRYISLEVEVSSGDSRDMHSILRKWGDSLIDDGSLPDEGWELNLNPSSGDVFLEHIKEIADELKSAGATIDSSCGLHCHVDARDYGWFDLFKLCQLYCKIEEGLYEIVSPSRRDNRYCGEAAETFCFSSWKTFQADLIEMLYSWRPQRNKRKCGTSYKEGWKGKKTRNNITFSERCEKYADARYLALNLHSFFYRGTIEFRHHNGTIDYTKMTNWGMICATIIGKGTQMKLDEIKLLPPGFEGLVKLLRPELAEWAISRRELFNKDVNSRQN